MVFFMVNNDNVLLPDKNAQYLIYMTGFSKV